MNVKCPNCGYTDQTNVKMELECPFCSEGVLKEYVPTPRQVTLKPSTTDNIKAYMENMRKSELLR